MITPELTKTPAGFRKSFWIGVVFELALVLLCVGLAETELDVYIGNFLLLPHYPLLMAIM